MDPTESLNAGIDAAVDPDPAVAEAKRREANDVKRWMERIERARKYDEPAREQYARDRRYARGDSGFEVDANLVGTYIDILEAFLYARDPDFDIRPGPTVQPPSVEAIRDAVEDALEQNGPPPEIRQAGLAAAQNAVMMGTPIAEVGNIAAAAEDMATEAHVRDQVEALRKRYAKRQREIKAFAETAEIIGTKLWKDGKLKKRGRPWTRSGLTVGLGVLKASWQERTAPSPETQQAINDLQTNIKRATLARQQIEDEPQSDELDAKIAEYQRQMQALQGQVERVVARGFVTDRVAAENFQVAPGYAIADHCDAPWNAERIPMLYTEACAEFSHVDKEKMRRATRYTARKPVMVKRDSAMVDDDVQASDADAFTSSATANVQDQQQAEGGDWVMVWEIWDRDSNTVLTGIEGVTCWVKEAWTPPATERFYPYFLFSTGEVDGQRHPQSLPSRSAKLVDEYNRIGSAEAEHRRRVVPSMLFHEGQVGADAMTSVNTAKSGEYVGVKTTQPNVDLRTLFVPKNYPPMDPALYDRTRVVAELERIWGVQEALSGAVEAEKTATEAEIQQTGFHARTGARRDALESALSELAQYTVEIARAYVTDEDARAIAGPDAFWPAYEGPDDLLRMLTVDIRAGSSGKPNTSAERQAWATQLPLLQNGIVQIGQLRQSSPLDIADALEQLLKITCERSGDRLDIDQLLPPAGAPQPVPTPGAVPPGAPGAPAEAGDLPPTDQPPGGNPATDPLQETAA